MSENGDTTQITPLHVADSETEDLDGEEVEEVVLSPSHSDRHPRTNE